MVDMGGMYNRERSERKTFTILYALLHISYLVLRSRLRLYPLKPVL